MSGRTFQFGDPVLCSTNNILQLLLLIATITGGYAANILVMIPLPFYSHTMNFLPIFKELAIRGHNVTIVSPFPQKTPVPNLTDIVVPNVMPDFVANLPSSFLLDMDSELIQLFAFWTICLTGSPKALQFEPVQNLIKDSDSKFDLVITETWFLQEPFVAFGHKFMAPVINIMPAFFFPLAAHMTGNHLPVAYTPISRLAYNDRMTFLERVKNSFHYYWDVIFGGVIYLNKQDAIMREYFKYPGSENLPPLQDMLRNTSLTLIDYNIALGYPAPLHKNVVPFGGVNVHSYDKLPADLQNIMDNAKEGIIYLSFGSFFSITTLKPHARMPYSHPNCKLFITHGGVHGLMEAIYHAVPVVVVAMMADQKFNARFIETVGIGYRLDKQIITEDQLLEAVHEVINNPSYRENIKERSTIFKDQPISTMDNVIYWIEYVIRHKGAPHLRPAVLDLHWYQYLMLDVILFYLLIIFLIVYIVKKVISLLFRCMKCSFFSSKVSKKNCKISKKKE